MTFCKQSLVVRDAQRNSNATGRNATLDLHVKESAWEVALRLGADELINWYDVTTSPERETSPFASKHISELLACFRLRDVPVLASNRVTHVTDVQGPMLGPDVVPALAAYELVRSVATTDALQTLLNFGLTVDGNVLLSLIDALADVAVVLIREGNHSITEQLVLAAEDGSVPRRRAAASACLERLARSELLQPVYAERVAKMVEDDAREIHERSVLAGTLGYLAEVAPLDHKVVDLLVRLSTIDDWLGWRSIEALARADRLIDFPEILSARIGLVLDNNQWRTEPKYERTEWAALTLGLLYLKRHTTFIQAMATAIVDADWLSASQLVTTVLSEHQQPGSTLVPKVIEDALIQRTMNRQGVSSAELDLFQAVASLSPDALAITRWDTVWNEWLPDSRVALANALGDAGYVGDDAKKNARALLLLLVQDSAFPVRRATYRSLAAQFPEALREFCSTWIGDIPNLHGEITSLRVRVAEAVAWLPDVSNPPMNKDRGDGQTDTIVGPEHQTVDHIVTKLTAQGNTVGGYQDYFAVLAYDREHIVRETAERSHRDRRNRDWADAYLARLRQVKDDNNESVLSNWCYGEALVRVGEESHAHALRQMASQAVPLHLQYWFERLSSAVEKRWHETTRDWNQPQLSQTGLVERREGEAILNEKDKYPVRVSVWAQPTAKLAHGHDWGGTMSLLSIDGVFAFFDANGAEFTLRMLEGGEPKEWRVKITEVSTTGTIVFVGIAPLV